MTTATTAGQTALSLPQGGGAIKGIGETFQANLFSGTGNHSVPIALSPGRGGFGPELSLSYSSGNGNGLFGLGWDLSLPRITRKTEKGLPRYDESDVFVLSGAEDLVPWLTQVVDPVSGEVTWLPEDPILRDEHTVSRYRPRTEGLFARIERWVHTATGDTHWRSISKDNITSRFGTDAGSRLTDPADDRRVYAWLLVETYDAFGNHSRYEYAADDPALYGDDPAQRLPEPFERNRSATNRYPRRMFYGNLPDPLLDPDQKPITYPDGSPVGVLRDGRRYAFEVVFDYGDWDLPTVTPHPEPPAEGQPELLGPGHPTPVRADRFSQFRAGFEIRTLRRCRRVLMFHHFAELGGPTLVRSTDYAYTTDPDTETSLLSAVTVRGHRRDADGTDHSAAMPAVTFSYTAFEPHQQRFRSLSARGGDLPPVGLNEPGLALVDLFGDGLPDVLQTSAGGFRYWRNLGDGVLDRPQLLAEIPAGISLDQAGVGFGDMAGNGTTDLLVHTGPLAGFFETTPDGTWKKFTPYATAPGFVPQDPNVRLLDLTGDGRADALQTRDEQFLWFPCLGEDGFGAPQSVARRHDLEAFPDVFFDDPGARIRLADMTGDGLNDIVLVHGGRIDYWPNLGYGRFGRRVSMANAPLLESDLDPRRLFLADLNGTGCADLVYVDARRTHFWFNRSGNTWSERQTILGTPPTTGATGTEFADVFGTGTATLVWGRDSTGAGDRNYAALDFCGGVKPYVLVGLDNSLGATTRISYAPSTRYYLDDLAAGTPWITAPPFPVQVVEKVEIVDRVGGTRRVSTYRYHHGHFDGREREFCGFGRVDHIDTVDPQTSTGGAHEVPPVETRSWFHTGVYFDDRGSAPQDYRDLTARFRQEWYAADAAAVPLTEHEVQTDDAAPEGYRALRGSPLRTEVYGLDGSIAADHPYEVSESRYRVVELQPRASNPHAVFLSHQLENLTHHYERNPRDPRTSHALTLEVDAFGNPLQSLTIGYGRRRPDPDLPSDADRERQGRTMITLTRTRYANAIDDPHRSPDDHRTPVPVETSTYELTGFSPLVADTGRFDYAEWVADDFARLAGAQTIAYEDTADPGVPQQRLIEQSRTFFRRDDLTELLPLGTVEPLALPGESHKLAFTAGLLDRSFGERVDDAMLADLGYLKGEDGGTWWIPSGLSFLSPDPADQPAAELAYARENFFVTHRSRDPFGNVSTSAQDPYVLLLTQTRDALGNRVRAEYDYRVLQPVRVTDPNGNRAEVVFDTLGLVAGRAVMGKTTETIGDSLTGFVVDLTAEQRAAFFADPLATAVPLLGPATTRIVYDLDRFARIGQPACAATLSRETHASEPLPAGGLRVQLSLSYSDGLGRVVQQKAPAEPGPVVDGGPVVDQRWVGSGWTIFTNKDKPARKFEPFFDDTPAFRFDHQFGVSSTLLYDPLDRVVATLHPDHTFEKVVFDSWRQETWDVNDTVLIDKPNDDPDVGGLLVGLDPSAYLPTWFAARETGELGAAEQSAAVQTALHAETPTVAYADSLGRPFLTIAHNRFERDGETVEELQPTRVVLDIEGNQRALVDPQDRIVMRYDFDLLGTRIRSSSMESGERWMLNDVVGQPVLAWNSRNQRVRTGYDVLRRPVDSFLTDGSGAEQLISRTVFGEAGPDPERLNLRGRIAQIFDQAGVLTHEAYDFKGNLLVGRRQLSLDHRATLDWAAAPALGDEVFLSRTTYDALDRASELASPDGSVVRATLNPVGLLESTEVTLASSDHATVFVTGIEYDAKGRRTMIDYGNGTRTRSSYDPLSSRLRRCQTLRGTELLQDLTYTYDPVGNVLSIDDAAQQTLFFANQVVTPSARYGYDATYRLIDAEGREHIGQAGAPETTWDDAARLHLPHPADGQAMRRYAERYDYDSVGNLRELVHAAAGGNWTRRFGYDEASLIEADRRSNRLSTTVVGGAAPETYRYDAHGNMTSMPHLPRLDWDFRDQLRVVDLGGGGTAYYVYDTAGERVRTVIEKNGGNLVEDRITLGGFEIFRRRDAAGAISLERTSLHVTDDQRRIACVETRTRGAEAGVPSQLIRYQLGNHLGSATLELDDAGQIISYEEYHPYGSTSFQAGRSVAEVSLKRYRFGGQVRDQETGLNHHGARYYAPWLGRWTSADPLGVKDGPNAYRSFHANPLIFTDPSGQQNVPPPINFYEKASTVQDGLRRIAELGLEHVKEFALARRASNGELMVLEGSGSSVDFHDPDLIPLGHTHTGEDIFSGPSDADLNILQERNVKEHWIFGEKNGWSRVRYNARRQTFSVLTQTPDGAATAVTFRRNPQYNPNGTPAEGVRWVSGPERTKVGEVTTPHGTRFSRLPPVTRLKAIANVSAKVVGIAGVASVAGEVIKDLHEGHPGRAAATMGIAGGLGYVLKRHPAAAILAAGAATIAAYDDQVKKEANAAGEALDDYLGFQDHSVIGGLNAAAYAVEKSFYNGVIKPLGTGIGEGAAAAYIRLTSDEYTLNPFKAAWFPW